MHKGSSEYHFVLVHGDCHGAWCWYKVITLLRRTASHKVTALHMGGHCSDPTQVEEFGSMAYYLKPLMVFMEGLVENEEVILVGHSRGGHDISIAMEKFPEKIAAAVFVTAGMPGPHLDIPTISKQFERSMDSPMDSEYTYGKGKGNPPTSFLFGPKFLESNLYQLSPSEDLTLATFLIRAAPLHVDFFCPTKETALTKENYGSVRRVYVVCDQDKVMKEEMQRWLIDTNPPDEVKVIKGSDHMVMMSKPHELLSCLLEIAEKYSNY